MTDNGSQFAKQETVKAKRKLEFDMICEAHGIDHRLTKPYHPWTNGQVERMHRSLKEQTVYRYFYQTHEQLRQHLGAFIQAYNFAKRLKTFKRRSAYEFICVRRRENPDNFHNDPHHLTTGLYSWMWSDLIPPHLRSSADSPSAASNSR